VNRRLDQSQKGFILATGMVTLLLISLLLMFLYRDSILQERMAGNSVGRMRALQSAETALREGEAAIEAGGDPRDPFRFEGFVAGSSCASANNRPQGFCKSLGSLSTATLSSMLDTGLVSTGYSAAAISADYIVQAPRYLIEVITPSTFSVSEGCSSATYRVLAKGWGSGGAVVVLQTVYVNRPTKC